MLRHSIVFSFLAFALALAVPRAQAEPAPTIFVANFSGHQVLKVDGDTGHTTILFTGTSSFQPEGLVVGPDGLLYICDSLNGLIWRFDPAQSPSGTNPHIVVTFSSGVFPEGPSFSGSDDLYVNTRGSGSQPVGGGSGADGVWVIPGIANPANPGPYTPTRIISSIGGFGEGTAFAATGHLLMVDESGNRVLSARAQPGTSPNFGPSFTQLITTHLSSPVGVAVNTCGDVLVASGTAIHRFTATKDPSTGDLQPAVFQNTYVTFGHSDVVTYMNRDASNTLWVATNSSSEGGKIWQILPFPSMPGDPISSCTTGVVPSSPLVGLKRLSQGANALLTSSQTQAVGLAITPTNVTPTAKTFTPAHPSNTWNFGPYTLTVSYRQVFTTFTQSFTAVMSRPTDVTFANPPFLAGTTVLRFPSLGGFVIQFQTSGSLPVAGADFALTDATGPAAQIVVAFHDPVQGFRHPGLAHGVDCSTSCPAFTDDITHDFWVLTDQASGGDINQWGSRYVVFDEPFLQSVAVLEPLTVTLNEPALSGNPQFNIGQNFTVSITVTDRNGIAVNGLVIRLSAARIMPLPIALQTVQATNSSTQENLMNNNSTGKYSIGVETDLFTGGTGTYQFTIFGDGFPPVVFNAQFKK